jgi:YidC/Oxa1 family membrane protein insertase
VIHFDYLYTAVSWVLLRWHSLFSLFMDKDSGLNWTLSIVMLVVTARVLLFRLFIKQVHYQRRMQEMAPKLNAIKEKYKDDRQAQQRETLKLQQDEGFNPLSGCLPMFLQFPVFICLFHVLRHLANSVNAANRYLAEGSGGLSPRDVRQLTLYTFSQSETASAAKAKLFGAPLAASFRDSGSQIMKLGGDPTSTRYVILPLLFISALATLATQLLVRANATVVPTGTSATVQKAMLWLFPLGVLASGLLFSFPLGVLLYWFTSNLWTLGQQAYIIRYHPPDAPAETNSPTSEASKSLAPRPGQKPNYAARARKALPPVVDASVEVDEVERPTTSGAVKGAAAKPAKPVTPAKVSPTKPNLSKPNLSKPAKAAAKPPVKPAASAPPKAPAPATSTSATVTPEDSAPDSVPSDAVNQPGARTPRPGQRPRTGGSRPAAKRPSQAKKRR